MNQFDNLMDDIKNALTLSKDNKKLFLPAIIINAVMLVFAIIAVFAIIIPLISFFQTFDSNGPGSWTSLYSFFLSLFFLILLFNLIQLSMDIGITGLVIQCADGEKPSFSLFFKAIAKNLIPVFFTKIGLSVIFILTAFLWIIPLLLYLGIAGVFTGPWSMMFLICSIQTFLGFWVVIKLETHKNGFESIGENIRFGRQHFWILILFTYMNYNISAYLPELLGVLGGMIASLFISYTMLTISKIIFLYTYRRHTKADDITPEW